MDPSIMKLLEEDELICFQDETMHSGADVEAFTAALNRDIEGNTSTSQPSNSDTAPLSQGSNHTSSQLFPPWQTSRQDKNTNGRNQQDLAGFLQQERHSSGMELKQHGYGPENQQQQIVTSRELNCIPLQQKQPQDDCQQWPVEQNNLHFSQTMGIQNFGKNPVHIRKPDRTHNSGSESQYPKLQKMNNQQAMATEQTINPMNHGKQVSFALLLPVIRPQLDKDRAMQLETLYVKLKKNEISKEGFVRHMRTIVGDQMLKMAVYKFQAQAARNSQTGPSQQSLQSQASAQSQNLKMPSVGTNHGTVSQSFAQVHQKDVTSPADVSHIRSSAAVLKTDPSNAMMDSNGKKSREMEHQSDSHGMPVNQMVLSSLSNINQEKEYPIIPNQGLSKQQQQHLHFSQFSSRVPSATSPAGPGDNAKTIPKKPSIGQKKPLESLGSLPPLPSKKQKVSGALLDQSIEQLNDVTAVSGVNLREEEEQLLSGPKEDIRVSEASRRVVQDEEEKLILQKIPLKKKLAKIMSKCGVKNISNDVDQCLSLCVEERMRGLISNLIRLSKQRVDIEKPRHQTLITSDVRQQIMAMNRKAKEERDKKQAEAERLQKLNEVGISCPEGNASVDGDKEKDEGRAKSVKANKEEDDKMRATAANVAARAAVGGDDMLSKWQLMAEQARQKREGGIDAASGSQLGDMSHKHLSSSGKNARENQEAEKMGQPSAAVSSGSSRQFARNQVVVPQTEVARSISVKDVIAVLEREPQMSKTTLIYRLYQKTHAYAVA
ncbi:hypothetical protein HYC85_008374 [Camellia sinensis]|uniref:RST domain-containing protein n=1 Tax=Camellia sinensis TaxID=4442 RepID=A0A7J7HU25_CAMSI|nr:hypothetical protein HYC85_008374 [Camellia sinensis]